MSVSGAVTLEGETGPVIGEAVNLDDELFFSPKRVDLEAGNDDVDGQRGKLFSVVGQPHKTGCTPSPP
jgi:hypothetical protein